MKAGAARSPGPVASRPGTVPLFGRPHPEVGQTARPTPWAGEFR